MNPEVERVVSAGRLSSVAGEKISQLEEGTFCYHRSWGVGKVSSWDLYGNRIEIDFEDKQSHPMELEFAAKSLKLLDPDHVLARRFADPEGLGEMAKDNPPAFVRLVLESYGGSMMLDDLEEVAKGTIIPEAKYKAWWESTKKKLRQEHSFVVPPRRTIPLELRDDSLSPAEAMVADFGAAREFPAKVKALDAILADLSVFELPEVELEPVVQGSEEAVSGALKINLGAAIELLLGRDDLIAAVKGLEPKNPDLSLAKILQDEQDQLVEVVRGLGVARQRRIYEFFPQAFGDSWVEQTFELFKGAGQRGLAEMSRILVENGKQRELLDFLQRGLRDRSLSSDVLAWVCKERKGLCEDIFDQEVAAALMNALERDHYDDEAKSRSNRVHDALINDAKLIPDLVGLLESAHVRTFARRMMMTPAMEELNRKSLLARIVKTRPELMELVSGSGEASKKEPDLIVSWESLEKRKEELNDIISKKIPQNRKEIQIAREYGDLRENFEYKAAKQQQAVLNRQRDELQADLKRAKGTDFADANTDSVSIGTVVDIEDEAGNKDTYTVLGAWDGDPEKHIISYQSEAGQVLIGNPVGAKVDMPTESGDTKSVTILDIRSSSPAGVTSSSEE